MAASHLTIEVWLIVGAIAAVCVTLCLSTVARIIQYERGLQELIKEVREIRIQRGQFPVGASKGDMRRAAVSAAKAASAVPPSRAA